MELDIRIQAEMAKEDLELYQLAFAAGYLPPSYGEWKKLATVSQLFAEIAAMPEDDVEGRAKAQRELEDIRSKFTTFVHDDVPGWGIVVKSGEKWPTPHRRSAQMPSALVLPSGIQS